MSRLILSRRAGQDIQRLYDFLAHVDAVVADKASVAIVDRLSALEADPTAGSPLFERPHIRKLVIDFGATGYLVFHQYLVDRDASLVLAILHRRELYDPQVIGRPEEIVDTTKPSRDSR